MKKNINTTDNVGEKRIDNSFQHMDRLAVASFDGFRLQTGLVVSLTDGKPLVPCGLLAQELDKLAKWMFLDDSLLPRHDDFSGISRFPFFKRYIWNPSFPWTYNVHVSYTPFLLGAYGGPVTQIFIEISFFQIARPVLDVPPDRTQRSQCRN